MNAWILVSSVGAAMRAGMGLCLCVVGQLTQAESLRDPMVPPVSESSGAPGVVQATPLALSDGMAVLVRQGVPYLMVGTRLYAKGQKVGQARIDRITETEVWFREAGVIRKVAVFAGIQRQVSKMIPTGPNPSSSTPTVAQSKP